MQIYHFRVLLDSTKDVFRDIEIAETETFEALHQAITRAFNFTGHEMASFYLSNNEWDKGEEIALMDMGEPGMGAAPRTMGETRLIDLLQAPGNKLLYVYDFFRMWIFYVELVAIRPAVPGTEYPRVSLMVGVPPGEYSRESSEHMEFKSEIDDGFYDDESEGLGEAYDGDEEGFESFDDDLDFR